MLIRKHDWHDLDGVAYLLDHGADPNHQRHWGFTALHHAIARDNQIEIITLLMDHGADPQRAQEGRTAVAMAARRGRGDILKLFQDRGTSMALDGVDRLIAACALDDDAAIDAIRTLRRTGDGTPGDGRKGAGRVCRQRQHRGCAMPARSRRECRTRCSSRAMATGTWRPGAPRCTCGVAHAAWRRWRCSLPAVRRSTPGRPLEPHAAGPGGEGLRRLLLEGATHARAGGRLACRRRFGRRHCVPLGLRRSR